MTDQTLHKAAEVLNNGGTIVCRTDTIYGILAPADNEHAVKNVYNIRARSDDKSPIVVIASDDQLYDSPTDEAKLFLSSVWPGKVSVILPSKTAPAWIQRQNASVAYRMPANKFLSELITQTGRLIAPSANTQGNTPARSIDEARDYFGDSVDMYIDGGVVNDNTPSLLYRISKNGETEQLR